MHSAHDPIGAASARLLGAGVARPDRLFALRVLGLLLDHADREGTVRVLPATLAGEFELDGARVEAAFLQLRAAGVLVPAAAGWHIDGFEGYEPGEVNAGAALAMIADLLEEPAVEPAAGPRPAPAPALAARAYPVLTGVMVILLLLVAASGRDGGTDVALQVAGIERADIDAADRPDVPHVRDVPARDRVATTDGMPDRSAPDRPGAPQPSDAPTTVLAPSVPAGPAPSPPGPPSCPDGSPALEIVDVDALPVSAREQIGAAWSVAPVDGPSWHVTITGTLANPAAAPMVVEAFDVVITTTDGEQVVEALHDPVLLPAGGSQEWQVTTATPLTAPPPDEEGVEAVLRVWRWAEACGGSAAR